jgi:hypothetical protein
LVAALTPSAHDCRGGITVVTGTADKAVNARRKLFLFGLLLFLVVIVIAWTFMAPGEDFLPGFARLLTGPTITRGTFSALSGRSYATGTFQGRAVAIRLQLKRSRYGQGYLVAAVQTDGVQTLNYDGIETRTLDEAGRRALYVIATHDLLLSVEDGWLKCLWRPQGLVIFPGEFSEKKWRETLEAMHLLATSLERDGQQISREKAEGS